MPELPNVALLLNGGASPPPQLPVVLRSASLAETPRGVADAFSDDELDDGRFRIRLERCVSARVDRLLRKREKVRVGWVFWGFGGGVRVGRVWVGIWEIVLHGPGKGQNNCWPVISNYMQ